MTELVSTEMQAFLTEFLKLLPFFIPIIIIQYGLMIYALVQAVRNEVAYLPRWGWILIIVLIDIIGPVIFLITGRKKEIEND